MKLEKFNELNQTMSKFFDACEFQLYHCDNYSKTQLVVYDRPNKRVIVEMKFINTIDIDRMNMKERHDTLEFNLIYHSCEYDEKQLNSAELSAVKNLIQMYK